MIDRSVQLVLGLLRQLVSNWPLKLAAVIISALLWVFVSNSTVTVTQRSLLVPITVQGMSGNQVATGIPEVVEVTVSGSDTRVDRLRPESFDAIIDLSGLNGRFEESIQVAGPADVNLLRVSPSDVIGVVESVTTRRVPVTVVLRGPHPDGRVLSTQVEPEGVLVRGRSAVLDQVAWAVAQVAADVTTTEVPVYASDAQGLPVPGVTVQPETVTVTLASEEVLVSRSIPVVLAQPQVSGLLVTVVSTTETVELVGPRDLLSDLETVAGTVSLTTQNIQPGDYTLPVVLNLPAGVVALQDPTVQVRLESPPLDR